MAWLSYLGGAKRARRNLWAAGEHGRVIYRSTCPRPSFYLAWACTSTSPLRDLVSPLRLVHPICFSFALPSSVPFPPRRASPLRASTPLTAILSFLPSFLPSLALRPRAIRGLEQCRLLPEGGERGNRNAEPASLSRRNCTPLRGSAPASFYLMQTVSVLYRRSFGQRGVSRVWFTLIASCGHWGRGGRGDILVFTMGIFKEEGRGGVWSSRKMSRVE